MLLLSCGIQLSLSFWSKPSKTSLVAIDNTTSSWYSACYFKSRNPHKVDLNQHLPQSHDRTSRLSWNKSGIRAVNAGQLCAVIPGIRAARLFSSCISISGQRLAAESSHQCVRTQRSGHIAQRCLELHCAIETDCSAGLKSTT